MKRPLDFDVTGPDVPRDLFPTGRVKFSLGVRRSADRRDAEARRRRAELMKLRTWQAWDVLKAVQDQTIGVAEVCRRVQQGGEAAVAEIRQDLQARALGEIPTFAAEAERYLEWYASERSENSAAQRRAQLARIGRAEIEREDATRITIGELRMHQIARRDLEQAIKSITERANTFESYRVALSGLHSWSVREESERARVQGRMPRWTANPASLIEAREKEKRVVTFARSEALKILAASEVYQEAYVRAFLHLGLRQDELQHTRLHDDLDVETWLWTIQRHPPDPRCPCRKCQGKGWRPKTRRSYRTFLVPDKPRGLRRSIARYLEESPAAPGDYVFRNPRTGEVWHDRALMEDLARLCKRAGVTYGRDVAKGKTMHAFRHTCATDLLRAGVRESVVAALLGDSVQTIVDTYIHLTAEDLADGVRKGPGYEP